MDPLVRIIGITGGSGTGKSAVTAYLLRRGFELIDADVVAREVVEPGSKCLEELVSVFGTDILKEGRLDRKFVSQMAFSDKEKNIKLNEITHRYIIDIFHERIDEMKSKSGAPRAILLDVPLLFESDLDEVCDATVATMATWETRLQRICERDGISFEDAELRMNAQPQDQYYIDRADFIIYNNGLLEELYQQADNILELIMPEDS